MTCPMRESASEARTLPGRYRVRPSRRREGEIRYAELLLDRWTLRLLAASSVTTSWSLAFATFIALHSWSALSSLHSTFSHRCHEGRQFTSVKFPIAVLVKLLDGACCHLRHVHSSDAALPRSSLSISLSPLTVRSFFAFRCLAAGWLS